MGDKIVILILAAGEMRDANAPDPLLALIGGQDLLTRVTRRACDTGIPVFVTIATDAIQRSAAIAREPVTIIPVPNSKTEMSAVIRAGIRSLPKGLDGVLIMLAQMPQISTEDLGVLLTHFAETGTKRAVSATDDTGHPGHPLVLPSRMFRLAARLSGDQTARVLLQYEDHSLVRLKPGHAHTEMNKPADWIGWRAQDAGAKR